MKYTKPLNRLPSLRYLLTLLLGVVVIAAVPNSPAPTLAAAKPPDQQRISPRSQALPNYDPRLSDKDEFEKFDLTSTKGKQRATLSESQSDTPGNIARNFLSSHTAVFEGYVDGTNCNQVWGWAWDQTRPNQFITLDIIAGTNLIGTVNANLFRQDLLNAGKGNGYHAFVFNVPDEVRNVQGQSITVNFTGTSTTLVGSPQLLWCGASLFPFDVPQATASAQGLTWEQGVEFSSSVNGTITHIRFWKDSGEPAGGHVGRIWTASGTQLASAQFFNETISGWQVAQLQTPLPITAGVRYRVSFNLNSAGAKTFNVLNSPIVSGPFTAWSSYYSTPAGSFPTTGSGSNLFADILFNSPQ